MKICLYKCKLNLLHICTSVNNIQCRNFDLCPTALNDYCDRDYFEANCPPGSIIFIKEARYGRMGLGTCLMTDYGHLNCYRYGSC